MIEPCHICGAESHIADRVGYWCKTHWDESIHASLSQPVLLRNASGEVDRSRERGLPTFRQIEVAAAVVRCGGYKGAAADLGISSGTIRSHLVHLAGRLDSHTMPSIAARLWAYPLFRRLVGSPDGWYRGTRLVVDARRGTP